MSEAVQVCHDTHDDDADLLRSYEAAVEALQRDALPRFTSEDEFLTYVATRS